VHIVTHLLVGWTLAEHTTKSPRDRALITWASVVPDLDGLGLLVDFIAPWLDWTVQWYERYHHVLGHSLPAALVCTVIFACFARQRLATACLVFVSFHLHLLGDLLAVDELAEHDADRRVYGLRPRPGDPARLFPGRPVQRARRRGVRRDGAPPLGVDAAKRLVAADVGDLCHLRPLRALGLEMRAELPGRACDRLRSVQGEP
jgi:hypothetical protein